MPQAAKNTRTTKDASGKAIRVPTHNTPAPMSEQLSADDGLAQLRKTYVAKAREALRATVLPRLEVCIAATPSGPTRNKLCDAQIILLAALEDLSS